MECFFQYHVLGSTRRSTGAMLIGKKRRNIMAEEQQAPQRVRVHKLQEAHVKELLKMEAACAEQLVEAGVNEASITVRTEDDFYLLPKKHNVFVTEADHQATGYLAWRDEAPGVAVVAEFRVNPSFLPFGLGEQLLAKLEEDARGASLKGAAIVVAEKASWTADLLKKAGFQKGEPVGQAKIADWFQRMGGAGSLDAGEVMWWKSFTSLYRSKLFK
jgi:N-acetylglutamate synthase-like GNAT family acetyltransferase